MDGRDHDRRVILLFLLFMVMGSYLMMNLFVGVVLDNFTITKDNAEGGLSLLTVAQQVSSPLNYAVDWWTTI